MAMNVTPQQLHLATQYPYDPPNRSFLFVNGRSLAIETPGEDPLVDAHVRLGDRRVRAADALDELNAAGAPSMATRTGCESRMAVMSAAWFVEFRQRLPWLLHVD